MRHRYSKRLLYGLFILHLVTSIAEANKLESMIESAFNSDKLSGLHAVLVLQRGKIVAEKYFDGHDERWGIPLGKRQFDATSLHDLRSVTKSITGLLYGIALSEGLVPDPDSVLNDQFPQYSDLANEPERRKIKIHHALSMTMGTRWDESVPYTSVANSEIAMEIASDRYRFFLDRPIIHEPGEIWNYNGGATALIAHLISVGTSRTIDVYAEEKLFPLSD